jgi:Tol biopolymer transport system component
MKRPSTLLICVTGLLALLAACDVPAPPPELRAPTVTPAYIGPKVTPTNAPPTPTVDPNGSGHIWFVRQGMLWVANADGTNAAPRSRRPITGTPAPAPDGRLVAFLSQSQLVVLDTVSGSERVVADDPGMANRQELSWSPDGRLIAYFTVGGLNAENLTTEPVWTVPADGSAAPKQLLTLKVTGYTQGPSFARIARWSPDGRRFAASSIYGPIQVIPLSVTAGDPFVVSGGEPDWSPDSRFLLFTQSLSGGLALFDVVGVASTPFTNEKREVGTRLAGEGAGPGAQFSPDGTQILYRSRTPDGSPAVAVRDLTGAEGLYLPGNNPVWSPDGAWIVFETGEATPTAFGLDWQSSGLARVRLDGSNMAQILQDGQMPAWSR